MSSHCGRYPNCGCGSDMGTKCHLDPGDPQLLENEKNIFPTEEDNQRMWDEKEKAYTREWNRASGIKKKRFKPTNITPKKKKRK